MDTNLKVHFLAGWFRAENLEDPQWLNLWINKAKGAKDQGCELVVFNVPMNQSTFTADANTITELEKLLQERYPLHTLMKIEPAKVEPDFMQSAFCFSNGVRFLVCTRDMEIKSYQCDKDFKPISLTPHSQSQITSFKTATEYHLYVRKQHKPEDFVTEHSTEIDA